MKTMDPLQTRTLGIVRIPLSQPCPRGCGARDLYGKAPNHNYIMLTGLCALDDSIYKAKHNQNCRDCGHWGMWHYHPHGCVIEGCSCDRPYTVFGQNKEKKQECDCGGSKLGYPPGIMHSHWNRPNDKSKWCPLRVE